jgi:hypothetical protein
MELKSSLVVVETEGEVFEGLSRDGRTRGLRRTGRIARTDCGLERVGAFLMKRDSWMCLPHIGED